MKLLDRRKITTGAAGLSNGRPAVDCGKSNSLCPLQGPRNTQRGPGAAEQKNIHEVHGFDPARHGKDGTRCRPFSARGGLRAIPFNVRKSANGAGGASDIEGKAAADSGEPAGK